MEYQTLSVGLFQHSNSDPFRSQKKKKMFNHNVVYGYI